MFSILKIYIYFCNIYLGMCNFPTAFPMMTGERILAAFLGPLVIVG